MRTFKQHVDVLLADGKTRLKVAITAQAARVWGWMKAKKC